MMKTTTKHLEAHKDKYMYAGVLASALLHTLNGVTVKMFLVAAFSFFRVWFS